MRKSRTFLAIILSLSFMLPAQAQQVACAGLFSDNKDKKMVTLPEALKIKSPELIYNLKFKTDFRFNSKEVPKEALVDLFQMLGNTQFFNTSEKITIEKGSLYLGQKIDGFLTAQAEYVYDKPNKFLHLTRISIVNSKNGQEQVLTKEPLDYTGKSFSKSEFNVVFEKDAALAKVVSSGDIKISETKPENVPETHKLHLLEKENVHAAEVSFPPSISGQAFDKINKWAKTVPYLDHVEISVVDSVNKQKWAIAKGQVRRFLEFAQDRFFKQAVGLLVMYMIVDGISGFSQDIAKYAVSIMQAQQATVSVKVKETKVDGQVTNTEQKFKISLPKKEDTSNQPPTGGK